MHRCRRKKIADNQPASFTHCIKTRRWTPSKETVDQSVQALTSIHAGKGFAGHPSASLDIAER